MAIEFFKQEEDQPDLEFLPDALLINPKLDGKLFDVFSFKKAKSGKGYMVYTSDFICWFFRKEKVIGQALEALDYYCKTGTGYQFVVQVDKKTKGKFHLGLDTDREVKYIPLENASYRLELSNESEDTAPNQTNEKKNTNPFLVTPKDRGLEQLNPVPLPPQTIDQPNDGASPPLVIPRGGKGRRGVQMTS